MKLASTLLAALAAALPATANEMPKTFEFSATFTFARESAKVIPLGDKNSIVSVRHLITANNDVATSPFLKAMVADCAYQVTNIGGKFEQAGACNYEDAAGDQLHETFRSTEQGKGSIAVIGGTGKFAGIRCEGEYAVIGAARQGAGGVGRKKGRCSFAL